MTHLPMALAVPLLLLCGCSDTGTRAGQEDSEQQRIETLSAEVVRLGGLDLPGAACGPPSIPGQNVVVFATADQCLSCLEVGALLRDLTRRGIPAPEAIIVTPAAHSREVCDYLRREKVRWRVVGIADEQLSEARAPRGIVYFELEPDGRIRRREHAATPLELATIILSQAGAAEPVHP